MRIYIGMALSMLIGISHAQSLEFIDRINQHMDKLQFSETDPLYIDHILPDMKKGTKSEKLPELFTLLKESGFIDSNVNIENIKVFDDTVESYVINAQRGLGLTEDGVAGKQLYVNLSVGNKLRKTALTEWRTQLENIYNESKASNESKIIIVNIPSYTLRVVDVPTGKIELESPVIVGKPSRQTPIFKTNIIGIKYNPTWTPPPGIMKADIYPRLGKEDTSWFQHHGLIITNVDGDEINPADISVADYKSNSYRISQPAGDSNALGLLKFETDNLDNIYLHDTNARRLFEKADRAQSSGCVRVKEWLKLASIITNKDVTNIQTNLDKGMTYIERVKKTPVYIMYSLADIKNDKTVFYPDIYNISKDNVLRGIYKKQ